MSKKELTRKGSAGEDKTEEQEALKQARRRDRELAAGTVEGCTHQQVMEAARRAFLRK